VRVAVVFALALAAALPVAAACLANPGLDPRAVAALFLVILVLAWLAVDREVWGWAARLHELTASPREARPTEADIRLPRDIAAAVAAMGVLANTIAARDQALRDGLQEKDRMLREIHHRVKNNLQVISSFLSLQERGLADLAARAALVDARQRIAALALIYRALYEGPDLRRVDMNVFLRELIAQLVATDDGSISTIQTELAIDSLVVDPDHLAPLALFAVEAIANARKHGLAETGGRLMVTFRAVDHEAELAITDSGHPDRHTAAMGEGVGRTLMMAFARQLGGAASFQPEDSGGLTARLTFPALPASLPGPAPAAGVEVSRSRPAG
jgi:two-component sensor histidine kinase